MPDDGKRDLDFSHRPGWNEPTWTERRAWPVEGPYRGTVFLLWFPCAVIFALGAAFDWQVPGWFGAPVALMATLGFFWMLASPRRPRG